MRFFHTIAAAVAALLAAAACYAVAGPSLDFFLGSICFVAIIVPPFAVRESGAFWAATAIAATSALLWTIPVFQHAIGVSAWFGCIAVLCAFTFAVAGGAAVLARWRIPPVLAAGAATILSLAWLTWPIWMSPWLAGGRIVLAVRIHPLFAINTAAVNLGIWTEQRIAYGLTNLGQDAAYQLPGTVIPCVLFQVIVAGVFFVIASIGRKPITAR